MFLKAFLSEENIMEDVELKTNETFQNNLLIFSEQNF